MKILILLATFIVISYAHQPLSDDVSIEIIFASYFLIELIIFVLIYVVYQFNQP